MGDMHFILNPHKIIITKIFNIISNILDFSEIITLYGNRLTPLISKGTQKQSLGFFKEYWWPYPKASPLKCEASCCNLIKKRLGKKKEEKGQIITKDKEEERMRKKETSAHRQVLGRNDMKREPCVLTTGADLGVWGIAPVRVTDSICC